MVAHCCQSRKVKITKIKKKIKWKMKTTELKKIKIKIFRKNPTKLSWPMSAKSDT